VSDEETLEMEMASEDRLILELVEELQVGSAPPEVDEVSSADSDQGLRRAYSELLGLLPYELEPMAPAPEVREAILRAAGGGRATVSSMERVEALRPPKSPAGRASGEARQQRWILPLAAGLAVALLGLSAWQFRLIQDQQQTIDRISAQLSGFGEAIPAAGSLRSEVAALESNLALVASPGVEVCTLWPSGEPALSPAARGVLYVAADHQRWYLSIEGLAPCPADHAYQVWFHAPGGPVSAGTLRTDGRTRLEMSSHSMPEGTKGVSITLEPEAGSPRPAGPRVLFGDEVMRIL